MLYPDNLAEMFAFPPTHHRSAHCVAHDVVAERPISRNGSTPISKISPASGILNWLSVAAITTIEARGTPAIPFEVNIRINSMVICSPMDKWILQAWAMKTVAKEQ